MSAAVCRVVHVDHVESRPSVPETASKPLHRLKQVRRQQQVSLRTIARRLNIGVAEARRQEDPKTDLPLSQLYAWQRALNVPLAELLVDSHLELSAPIQQRAQLVRVMKTVASLLEYADTEPVRWLADMLFEQLTEIMPELTEIGPWQPSGSQRTLEEVGQVYERQFSHAVLSEAV